MELTEYSMAMAFSEDHESVLLIEKNRPVLLVGCWTGVGGHIEPNESALAAVEREFGEETGLLWPADRWTPAGVFSDNETFVIHVFHAQGDIAQAQSITEERVAPHRLDALANLPQGPRLMEYLAAALAAAPSRGPSRPRLR